MTSGTSADSASTVRPRPNLVLLMVDEHSWDSIGYVNPLVKTPNLDRLARGGMIFHAGHCAAMPCVPSRACMASGLNNHRWQRVSSSPFEGFLKEGSWTWSHALRAAGYRTGVFGALHAFPVRANHGFDVMKMCDYSERSRLDSGDPRWREDYHEWMKAQGLDMALQPNGERAKSNGALTGYEWPHSLDQHPISWIRDQAIEFMDGQRGMKQPFAIQISFPYPHPPYIPAEPFASMYDPESIECPTDSWTDMEGYIPALDFDPKAGFNGISTRPEKKAFQVLTAKYLGLVSQIDDAVGRMLKHVDLTNTLVIYLSDHGDFRGKRGRLWKIPTIPFEGSSHVPFFAAGHGVPTGAVCENPVSLLDLAPTFLRAAGLEIPVDLDGLPLQDYFENPEFGAGRTIYCHGSFGIETAQMGKIKYFRTEDKSQEMLFDLASDPLEKRNLAADPEWAGVKSQMVREMDKVFDKPAAALPRFDADSRETSQG